MNAILPHLSLLGLLLLVLPVAAEAPLALADGDRVVLLGNTLIERAQRTDYLETSWTSRYPKAGITFRNLGWSGDTVFGEARASFDPPEVGYRRLIERVQAEKPTVILIAYGLNESFGGEAGVPRFEKGLATLLDDLTKITPRLVLMSPLLQEDLGRPLPVPTEANQRIRRYRDVLKEVAEKRRLAYIELTDLPDDLHQQPWTDNGAHLTPYGYWRLGQVLDRRLGLPGREWAIEIDFLKGKVASSVGTRVGASKPGSVEHEITDDLLPEASPPAGTKADSGRRLRVSGLPGGPYILHIDGQAVRNASSREWEKGIYLDQGPEFDQVEELRAAIIAKNREYFYRWRPQNETYLFGFRKHEQGQNAKEVPQFDPLVAGLEEKIARLRVPVTHKYEIVPAAK